LRTANCRAQVIYVTDTHPLVFWSSNRQPRLGKRARRILQETEKGKHSVIVPVVVLEEINRLVERNVVQLYVPFRRWAEELERSPNFQVQAYTLAILLESVSLAAIRDPEDRVIVATARHLRCPLITADGIIQDGDWVDTVWE
jgi:PIN domain nuclease of toxin-antitoxin system